MASLIDDARRARAEAARVRRETRRLAADAARACLRTQLLRTGGMPSAWSTLRWSSPGDDLNAVLELV